MYLSNRQDPVLQNHVFPPMQANKSLSRRNLCEFLSKNTDLVLSENALNSVYELTFSENHCNYNKAIWVLNRVT